ncbi:Aldo/keto reductase, partial [Thozetella sp. PMI_491]
MAPPIPTRKLGKNGPEVPAMGLGLMGISMCYGNPEPDEERFKVLDRAYELGCTHWDSSDLYGDCEVLLGKWFKRTGKRDDIFLATKFAFVLDESGGVIGIDSSPEHLKKAFNKSLERLGVDCVDLYYVHRVNYETPIEATMRGLVELKEQGKIKYIGLSEVSSATLRRAYKVHPVDVVQIEYSPIFRDIEGPEGTDLLATCRELGVTVVAYSPLSRGMLTGAVTQASDISAEGDWRSTNFPIFSPDNLAGNAKLAAQFGEFAKRKGCTPAQLALAWLLKQGDDIIPIPGTKKVKYLEDNWGALQVQLSDQEVKEIRDFFESTDFAGKR